MEIGINAAEGVERSEALDAHVGAKLERVRRRFGERLTRVRIFLKDVNAHKGGIDKSCTMEARPSGHDPLAVEARDADAYQVVKDAADRLEKALDKHLTPERREHGPAR